MITTIKTLFQKGYNKSQIAEMLEVDRKTVRVKLQQLEKGVVERKQRQTILDPHLEYIQAQVGKELSAKRIFQDLQRENDFRGSYDTVKKYVASIKKSPPQVSMVLNSFLEEVLALSLFL